MRDIALGQYFPGNSFLHRMDPRVKMVLTFFTFSGGIPRLGKGFAGRSLFLHCGTAFKAAGKAGAQKHKAGYPLVLITSALNIFYVSEGAAVLVVGNPHNNKGLITASFIAIRIICLIAGSSLLTYTTSPTTLTDALERLLSPLKIVRLDVHELAMMMTIALRFIPTLIEETDKIMSAQKARGADLESGGPMQRIRALVPIVVPLFVSSFRRASDLATAMECRCYRGGMGRTRMKQMKMRAADILCRGCAGGHCGSFRFEFL